MPEKEVHEFRGFADHPRDEMRVMRLLFLIGIIVVMEEIARIRAKLGAAFCIKTGIL
jgi:hypothetical protein